MLTRTVAVICMALSAAGRPAQTTAARQRPRWSRNCPRLCAGFTIGSAQEPDVLKRYGPGLFEPGEGHGGGRYYVDRGHHLTLHVEIGVDRMIDWVEVREGVKLPPSPGEAQRLRRAESRRLPRRFTIGSGYRLGASRARVVTGLGRPASVEHAEGEEILLYRVRAPNTPVPNTKREARLYFRRGRLVGFSLADPE